MSQRAVAVLMGLSDQDFQILDGHRYFVPFFFFGIDEFPPGKAEQHIHLVNADRLEVGEIGVQIIPHIFHTQWVGHYFPVYNRFLFRCMPAMDRVINFLLHKDG
jgi:hypothetical protein